MNRSAARRLPMESNPAVNPRMDRPLRIAMTCYPTLGGSGVVATELGLSLVARGHQVHFVCADVPERLRPFVNERKESQLPGLLFHPVIVDEYLLPNMGSYPLALANRLAQVTRDHDLDLWHLHYGVPHAVSAWLARQLVNASPRSSDKATSAPSENARSAIKTVITLHGTDVTGVGSSPSLRDVHRFALCACDALTVPSAFLRQAAFDQLELPIETPIEVIPNFVNTSVFYPAINNGSEARSATSQRPFTLCHASNFRPVKRIDDIVQILAAVRRATTRPVQLILVGEGPERPRIEDLVRSLGLSQHVQFLGVQQTLTRTLQQSDLFLLPSQNESFGLAALEALSCGVPVIASRVGGLPEVIETGDRESGLLLPVGDVAAMAAAVVQLIEDPRRHARMRAAARDSVLARFQQADRVAQYEACYRRLMTT